MGIGAPPVHRRDRRDHPRRGRAADQVAGVRVAGDQLERAPLAGIANVAATPLGPALDLVPEPAQPQLQRDPRTDIYEFRLDDGLRVRATPALCADLKALLAHYDRELAPLADSILTLRPVARPARATA